jgi:hypothetical protein
MADKWDILWNDDARYIFPCPFCGKKMKSHSSAHTGYNHIISHECEVCLFSVDTPDYYCEDLIEHILGFYRHKSENVGN